MAKPILVIDDDIELTELLSEYLGPEGFEVEAVGTPEKGVELALSGRHALVVLDVMLPGGQRLRGAARDPLPLGRAR